MNTRKLEELSDTAFTIIRKKCGGGFTYLRDGKIRLSRTKEPDKSTREWIQSLAIPPAWTDVNIVDNKSQKIYAVGRDTGGKKQYIYNPSWALGQQKLKFNRLPYFAEQLEKMRVITAEHLNCNKLNKEKVLACMLRLVDIAYFRPGNSHYTSQNNSYGLTTLRSKHLTIEDGELTFSYTGKSNVEQEKHIKDKELADVVRQLNDLPGYRIFKYFDEHNQKKYINSDDLNDYIRKLMSDEYSAKDFRTWAGTMLAAVYLNKHASINQNTSIDKQEYIKQTINHCLQHVSTKLGNTPEVCKQSYISPAVMAAFERGVTLDDYQLKATKSQQSELSPDEAKLILLLKDYQIQ